MMDFVVSLLLLFSLQSATCQPKNQMFPPRLDLLINRVEQIQHVNPDELDSFPYRITPDRMSVYLSSNGSNKTTTCEREFDEIISAALKRQKWALKVLDAWGKPLPSGLLKGNIFWTGNYDECVQQLYLSSNKTFLPQPFDTQHCTLFPITSSTADVSAIFKGITLGMCVPSSCDRQMVAVVFRSFFKSSNISEDNLACSNDYPNGQKGLTTGAIATCAVLSFLGLLVLIGTVVDLSFTSRLKSDENSPLHTPPAATSSMMFLADFSALRTLRRIFTMKKAKDENSFQFLNGVRVLALFWVIIGHSTLDSLAYTSNIIDVFAWTHNFFFQLITNALFTVDTFFVITGFLTAVLFIRQLKKERLSLRLMILYYVHRYIRLTPPFLLLLLVSINLTPYFGHGPFYPAQRGFESEGCRDRYWWTSILYIGNLVGSDQMCFGIAWYLFNDMQFHWIAPLALVPFALGKKSLGSVVTIFLIFIGIFSILITLLYYPGMSLDPLTMFEFAPGTNFFHNIYIVPWCRVSAYAVGLLTGFVLLMTGRTYRLNIYAKLVGTLLAIAIGLVCLFSIYPQNTTVSGLSRTSLVAYQSLSRTGWSLAIAWLIFLCSTNQGGIVNTILSWPIWSPFAQLNYAAYLVHPTILYIIIFNRTVPLYYQPHIIVNNYVSHIFFSYLAAIVVNIFLETPFVVIEKKLFRPRKSPTSERIN